MKVKERAALIAVLKARFEKYPARHEGLSWATVQERLDTAKPAKWQALADMERTGGEPDVVAWDAKAGLTFFDCAAESPSGRRSLCYDREAWESRKEARPENNALDLAAELGIELLSEAQYRHLQTLGKFDLKTSSWILTPPAIRKLGGALFCDRRYDQVFTYHNGAQSYYAVRGFRGALTV